MIGERVQKYRKEAGYTLTELADKAGVAKSYLSALERNIQTNPSVQFLQKLASVLGVTIDQLLKDRPVINNKFEYESIDDEWKQLIQEALNSGVSKEEFRFFIEYNRYKKWKASNKS